MEVGLQEFEDAFYELVDPPHPKESDSVQPEMLIKKHLRAPVVFFILLVLYWRGFQKLTYALVAEYRRLIWGLKIALR